MPTLVHLADERETSSIKKNGIKIGKHRQGIFCMPVLTNFYLSHQWLRELKRSGVKTFVGVYFKMDSKARVYAGRYNQEHRHIELGEAIKEIQAIDDPLGYEIIIDRKIEAKEVDKIKNLPQNIGWRYKPRANGLKPCGCDYCIKSTIKGNRVRQKYDPKEQSISYKEILERLKIENDISEIENLLCSVRSKKRKGDPTELLFLLDKNSTSIDQEIALTLKMFKHKVSRAILLQLLDKDDSDTREFAADSLLELYGKDAEQTLKDYNDEAIQKSINDWRDKK
ncbi:MAG: hypothetical protein JWR72_1885 [Flavisolibacter sp.]|nr:hypothetical protein [Flavisolibacter sp.]